MAKLIEAVDFHKIVTVDLHSGLVEGFFRIPLVHLFGAHIFVPVLQKLGQEIVIVSPDAGAAKRAQKLAELLNVPLTYMEKRRSLDNLHQVDEMRLIGNTEGKTAVLIDDVVTSGSTLVKSAYLLKDKGAKKVIACVTHADLIGGTRQVLQESPIDRIYVSDTIAVPEEYKFPKLHTVSIASLLSEQIKKMI
jgi:ribose-phosphate pyrophosphokinase